MRKRPILTRVECFLEHYYYSSPAFLPLHIPIHPEDLDGVLKEKAFDQGSNKPTFHGLPFKLLCHNNFIMYSK